jgi:zinc finger CCCH domain-containing protein 13
MASIEIDVPKEFDLTTSDPSHGTVDSLANTLANVDIQEDKTQEKDIQPPRDLHVYTNLELLLLSKSSLVKAPDDMPALKDWFGCALICESIYK